MYRNKITTLENKIIKQFSIEEDFLTELKGIKTFSTKWHVPQILSIKPMEVHYSRIYANTLAEGIDKVTIKQVDAYLERIKSNGCSRDFKEKDYSEALSVLPKEFARQIKTKPETVVHGDFRPYNMLEGDVLIDFEFAHNGVIEEDLAKFYVELLSLNPKLATDMHSYAKAQSYNTFLFHCLLIGYKQLDIGFYDKRDISRFIRQIKE